MSRRKFVLFSASLLLACSLLGLSFSLFSDPVNPWAGHRIRLGMSEVEVQTIMGRPADHEYHPWEVSLTMLPAPGTLPEWEKMWVGDEWMVLVHFDANMKVCHSSCVVKNEDEPVQNTISQSLWHTIGRVLGW